jgi:hypothetical protein
MKMTVYQHKQGLWKGYWFYGWETGQSSPFPTRKAAEQALALRKPTGMTSAKAQTFNQGVTNG